MKPEGAYEVLARAQALEAQGRQIIHLELGQPDFATFENISEAGRQAIAQGRTHYTSPAGMPVLRQAIAEAAGQQRGVHFLPEQVVVGPGTKPNMFYSTLALVGPGDEVLYPDPGFPTYKAMVGVAGGIAVPVPLKEENQFSFDLDAFDRLINERTRLIILNSPGNPTGGVMPLSDLEHIAEAAQRYDCWVLSDEIYMRILYDGQQAPSIVRFPGMMERTVVVDGFSKTYAMTGWRLGYGIMPVELAKRIDLLLTHSVGCTAEFTQIAGLEAIRGPQDPVAEVVREYQFAPRPDRKRAQQHTWHHLPDAAGRVLCFSKCHVFREKVERAGRPVVGRSGRRRAAGHCLRGLWGGLHTPVVFHIQGAHHSRSWTASASPSASCTKRASSASLNPGPRSADFGLLHWFSKAQAEIVYTPAHPETCT